MFPMIDIGDECFGGEMSVIDEGSDGVCCQISMTEQDPVYTLQESSMMSRP